MQPFSRGHAQKCSLGLRAHSRPAAWGLRPGKCQDACSPRLPRPLWTQRRDVGDRPTKGTRVGLPEPDIHTVWACSVCRRAFPVKGAGPLVAGSVNAACFLCLNVPLPMTVTVDLREKHQSRYRGDCGTSLCTTSVLCPKGEKVAPESSFLPVVVSCRLRHACGWGLPDASGRSNFSSRKTSEERPSDRS